MIAVLCILSLNAFSQNKKKQDITSIMNMCGCYKVTFNFAETFAPDKKYEFHDNYSSWGYEWVTPVVQEKNKIVLQHLLVVMDTMVIKHWRQDWLYENTDLYTYDQNNKWSYVSRAANDVKGQWTQKVFQVDDSPRYEGTATWVHVDGKDYWEGTADAPLPRREFSKRDDYNVTKRGNRHEITSYGWLHEQDNEKIIRDNGKDELLAKEKGWNTYEKADPAKCKPAEEWWSKNQIYWADVRQAWDKVFATNKTIEIKMVVEGKKMFERFFELGDEMVKGGYNSELARGKINEILDLHLLKPTSIASR